ncbi:hypothetical protein J5X92_03020 [Alteromonas sp. K632G]|uniref:hypothetical protein n=1 Tax=Alteromonas sp. K632G TaxID=2820757 RepID=UPI001AD6D95F|nr:hypothetical protein [Alteromonas sp. K632G]MBO7921185.1 hypothetical protein [Alteromonas sp. K632G]
MTYAPKFIKPSRKGDESPKLSNEWVTLNNLRRIETSIVLDLNVLSTMKDVMRGKTNLAESGLEGLVSFFNANSVFITPGFGFSEADKAYIEDLVITYE